MILTAHQPTFLPWLGLFHKIASADAFLLFDDVQQEDSGFENRTRIRTRNGPQWLTVPVCRGRELKLKDVKVCNDQPWRRKHFRTLEMNYRGAPFWPQYEPWLCWLYDQTFECLTILDATAITFITAELGYGERPPRMLSGLHLNSTKSQLVLDACRALGADAYIFGAKGRDYADVAAFRAAGVTPLIQEFKAPDDPPLSALDSLLRLGPEETRRLMMDCGTIREMR